MTRTVRDAAMMLNVLAGSDAGDPWSKEADQHRTDYVAALRTDALKGQRIGIMRGLSGQNETTNPVYNQAVQDLAAQGAEIVEIADTGFVDLGSQMMDVKLTREFKDDINAYLAGTPSAVKVRTLAELIAFSDTEPHEKLHDHGRWDLAEATQGRKSPDYEEIRSKAETATGEQGIDRLLKQYNVVALVTLTGGPAGLIQPDGSGGARRAAAPGSPPPAPSATGYAAIAGYPHLTVPMGYVNGLPVGLSFIGPKWSEKTLLSFGYAYEQATKKRVPPTAYKQATASEKKS
jgi:amidase